MKSAQTLSTCNISTVVLSTVGLSFCCHRLVDIDMSRDPAE